MNIQDITNLCSDLKSVTTDIKWEDHLCFNIGGKMFFITSLENKPTTASFKVSDEDFDTLTQMEGLKPAPYLGRYKWVHIDDINRFSEQKWRTLIQQSYHLIASKLSKKNRKTLGIDL